MKRWIFVVCMVLSLVVGLGPAKIGAQEGGIGLELKDEQDLNKLTEKVSDKDIVLSNLEWDFGSEYSEEEIKVMKKNIEVQGKKGLALLANLNNGLIEADDFKWSPVVEEILDKTNEEIIDIFTELVADMKDRGYQPMYEAIELEIRTDPEIGEMVACIVPWEKEDGKDSLIQIINLNYDSEIVGIFIEEAEEE